MSISVSTFDSVFDGVFVLAGNAVGDSFVLVNVDRIMSMIRRHYTKGCRYCNRRATRDDAAATACTLVPFTTPRRRVRLHCQIEGYHSHELLVEGLSVDGAASSAASDQRSAQGWRKNLRNRFGPLLLPQSSWKLAGPGERPLAI